VEYLVRDPVIDEETLRNFTFTVTNEKGVEVELVPGGAEIALSKANREQYGTMVAKYYLKEQVKDEIRAFSEGFHDVIPVEVISVFDVDELSLIMGGTPYLDVDDWRENTEYGGEFTDRHLVINWFWEVLEKLTQDQLRKFLLFCTGMPRVPIEGFK
jgi:hypothetical protein